MFADGEPAFSNKTGISVLLSQIRIKKTKFFTEVYNSNKFTQQDPPSICA